MKKGIFKINKRGFSLVEAMVASAISIGIGAAALQLFIQGSNIWHLTTAQSELRSSAQAAMEYMTSELKSATRTSSDIPSPNLTIPSQPNNTSIDFYLPKDLDGNWSIIDSLGDTEWDTSNKIQYQYIPGQQRLRRLEKGNQFTISNYVTSIEFEDYNIDSSLYNDELRIILTVSKTATPQRTVTVTLTSIVKLRN